MNSRISLLISTLIPILLIIAPLAMALPLPQGYVADFVKNAPMPISAKLVNQNFIFQNATWYLNSTDHNFHVKGYVKNTVARAANIVILLNFADNATGTTLATGGGFNYGSLQGIAANAIIPFDIKTGYTANDTQEFKTIIGGM